MKGITGIILAGGRAQRMGGDDKGLTTINGKPMVEHVIERLVPQVSSLVISANRNQQRYEEFGYPVTEDKNNKFDGPLAGIASAIEITDTPLILVTPCDTPLLPTDLVEQLHHAMQQSDSVIAVANDGERMQQLCFLASRSIVNSIRERLANDERRVYRWLESLNPAVCDFHSTLLFSNINTPEEQSAIEQQLLNHS